jgi:hypothetical protein
MLKKINNRTKKEYISRKKTRNFEFSFERSLNDIERPLSPQSPLKKEQETKERMFKNVPLFCGNKAHVLFFHSNFDDILLRNKKN